MPSTVMGVEGSIETGISRPTVANPAPFPATNQTHGNRPPYAVSKRLLDLALASMLVLLTLPVLLLAMAAIVLTTGRMPLLVQRRLGLHGRSFRMLKLRTMHDAPTVMKSPDDPRVTAVGRVLRRTSIDELPQLVNVLAGQMSLIGPRPVLAAEAALYPAAWQRRFSVKPGLSGLWQVSGRSSLSLNQWMALDRLYLRKRTLVFDLGILLRTVQAVITMRGAW